MGPNPILDALWQPQNADAEMHFEAQEFLLRFGQTGTRQKSIL